MSFLSLVLEGRHRTLRQIAFVCKALSDAHTALVASQTSCSLVRQVRQAAPRRRVDHGATFATRRNAISFVGRLM
jgi:hypothetical protein